jgi:hypothetical protein
MIHPDIKQPGTNSLYWDDGFDPLNSSALMFPMKPLPIAGNAAVVLGINDDIMMGNPLIEIYN